MDNQKSNQGSARDTSQGTGTSMGKDQTTSREGSGSKDQMAGREGTGTSMGKDQSTGRSSTGGASSGAGSTGSMGTSSGAGSSGSMGGSSAAGSTGSTSGASSMSSSGETRTSGGSSMGGMGGDSMARSAGEAHRTIDQAAQAAKPVVNRLASSAHTGVDRMTDLLSGASATMSERSRQLNEAYRNLADSGREYVRNSPGTAVMIALGAGFILAKLLGGGRREYRDYRD